MKYFAFGVLFFAISAAGCDIAPAPVEIPKDKISTNLPMPPSSNIENSGWTTDDGKTETLGELKGKVVVLDFWATYCKPCLEEIPDLVELQNKYREDGLQIRGLHVGGKEDKVFVPDFVRKLKMNYTIAAPQEALTDILLANNSAIPQTFVFDRKGILVKHFTGYDAQVRAELEQIVQNALKK